MVLKQFQRGPWLRGAALDARCLAILHADLHQRGTQLRNDLIIIFVEPPGAIHLRFHHLGRRLRKIGGDWIGYGQ